MPINPRNRILNVVPSKDVERDWSFQAAEDSGALAAAPLPAAIDLREDWWKIGDQGQTGSCVGWACADGVLRWHFVKTGRLAADEKLSVRQVWMASKEIDEWAMPSTFLEAAGTSLKSALDVARNYGVVTEATLPFAGAFYPGDPKIFYATSAQRKVASYFNLGTSPDKWREWLARSGPILTRLDCDDAWFDAEATGGVLHNYVKPAQPAGHAVAIVGYTADHSIIRNSWGTSNWGDNGFAYADNAYAAVAFTEAYGVSL